MQDFHYNYIKRKYGDKVEMLLTGTDSLIYKIGTENVQEDVYKDKELFDFSNHVKGSKYCNNSNNLVAGQMKDDTSGVSIKGFLGLESKMYTFITEFIHEFKKAKDINKNFVDDQLKYKDYKNLLFKKQKNINIRHKMIRIQSKHQIQDHLELKNFFGFLQ